MCGHDPRARDVGYGQYAVQHGPCLAAIEDAEVFVVPKVYDDATVLGCIATAMLLARNDRERGSSLLEDVRQQQGDIKHVRARLAADIRSRLMEIRTSMQLLRTRRRHLDAQRQDALGLLDQKIGADERLMLELLRTHMPTQARVAHDPDHDRLHAAVGDTSAVPARDQQQGHDLGLHWPRDGRDCFASAE